MSASEEILRVAAKGDGVTASGRHVPLTAPGDTVEPGGAITPGPHHAAPPCRHFPRCGGCQIQHLDEETLAAFVRDRVVLAAEGQGLTAERVAPVHLSPPCSRRRAMLHAANAGGKPQIGFNEERSHRIVDMHECHVLAPELFALVAPLRAMLARRRGKYALTIELALTDLGPDCAIKGLEVDGLEETKRLTEFCRANGLARLTLDQGWGPEGFWEPEPVTVTLSGVPVDFPPGAFLQATADGEEALAAAVREWLGGCGRVADLFAGLGTFAFAVTSAVRPEPVEGRWPGGSRGSEAKLSRSDTGTPRTEVVGGGPSAVLAAEAARDAHLACRTAANRARLPVEAAHRDLFRNPLRPEELQGFDGVVLDPPRAGAREQVAQLAASGVPRIAYVSCNPASWARDARTLVDAGYRLAELRPVGQFRWSTHVELASLFLR